MIHEGRHFLDDFQPIMPISLFEESETAYLSRILNRRSSDHEQKAADHPLLTGANATPCEKITGDCSAAIRN